MPVIENPVLSGEHFNRHWDQEKYENFRSKIHQYREWSDDAYAEPNRDESIRKWRRVFGDDFAKGEVLEKAVSFSASVLHRDGGSVQLVETMRCLLVLLGAATTGSAPQGESYQVQQPSVSLHAVSTVVPYQLVVQPHSQPRHLTHIKDTS
jgi:hypothetical protein